MTYTVYYQRETPRGNRVTYAEDPTISANRAFNAAYGHRNARRITWIRAGNGQILRVPA